MQPDLGQIRLRLTRRYAFISSLVLLVFGVGVYLQVAESRNRLVRAQLQQVASTAASQMPLILHELAEYQTESSSERLSELAEIGMLETQAVNLAGKQILWFDRNLTELSRYGNYKTAGKHLVQSRQRQQKQFIAIPNGLAYWRPVFVRPSMQEDAELQGYVLVALSSNSSQSELHRLRNGLMAGGSLAVVTAILLSQWMVSSSIKPVREQIERLVRFTADASHELRHPLTAIRAVIGSIRQRGLLSCTDPILSNKVDLIDQAAERMADLVDDLLLLARLDRSLPDTRHWITFDLSDLVEDVVDLHHESAQSLGIDLRTKSNQPVLIRGNPDRLRQLLNNLIANALRFGPRGSQVMIELVREAKTVLLSIEDEGPGIPPEQRKLVFNRFWQADQARTGSSSGLGLSIALAIAQSHGGSVEVREGRCGGCRMVVCLPLA